MSIKRITSAFLSLIMAAGVFGASAVYAAPEDDFVMNPVDPNGYEKKINEDEDPLIRYNSYEYASQEDKLKDMEMLYSRYGYEIYFEYYTGEVAVKNTVTGQVLATNPYTIGAPNMSSGNYTNRLLSQILLSYKFNNATYEMVSYVEAAQKGQIKAKNIKNGIRVEYTLGDEITTRLVPRRIERSRFEKKILTVMESKIFEATGDERTANFLFNKFQKFFTLYDPYDDSLSEGAIKDMNRLYPVTEKMAIYVVEDDIASKDLKFLESLIKQYCPDYTYDDLEADHEMTEYESEDIAPPLFRMALEYTLSEDGLEVRLPANGIRFDESVYQLESVSVLPFMGCGNSNYSGYNFIPDGSGALVRFEDVQNSVYNVSGKMYGADYAYHVISGQHAEVMRYPVFGVVTDVPGTYSEYDKNGKVTSSREVTKTEGYVAIITEGDSMASLMSSSGGSTFRYNTVYASFNPRPSDSYNLADSISISNKDATWSVTSSRKYTGSYRIKYVMLTNEYTAAEAGLKSYYDASYVGMAKVYRDYLESNGIITRLTNNDVKSDVPLYIESFGSIETKETFMSFPITVNTPLTTFENVKTMYDELSGAGVNNINFKLTGFANGGMKSTVPYKLKFVKELGGNSGFEDLVKYSKEKGFGVYPEFDFAYISNEGLFDGVSLKAHAVKTIDNRYTSKRYYNTATQTFENDFALAISSSVYSYLYEGLNSKYSKYEANGISASTLGSDLNSDFDEDDPYNREDSKVFTNSLLEEMGKTYDVMISKGNAYTFKNADVILDLATESSNYQKASESIPFIGMVLHGYIETAGSAINMEGDLDTVILRCIESGTSLYYILSYQNTTSLKENIDYNSYYSVGYDVWKDEVINKYNILNDAVKDLQTSRIVDHSFIDAKRVADDDEVAADAAELQAEIERQREEARIEAEKEALRQERENRLNTTIRDDDNEDDIGDDDDDNTDLPSDGTGTGDGEMTAEEFAASLQEKYKTVEGTVVNVEYEGGVNFILNFNSFDITVNLNGQEHVVKSLGFIRIS